ncbi:MAG: NUDIX hydrolase [Ktedonobacteraceae bacterium]|nr:NUDIX hydrolase [Ktedonobacteraceae bacterium]MBO0790808.1 NUDIX hydrolase [Ktedonobacteraceae bacterium]
MRAYSAGGVVFRLTPMCPSGRNHLAICQHKPVVPELEQTMEVALVGRKHAGLWALPKGTPMPGETVEQVAVREVEEETGLKVHLIGYIGSISYSFIREHIRYHKQVRHFLLEAVGGDTALHDHEYDCVEWFPLYEACRRLTYQNEVHILYQAEEMLQQWLAYQQRKEGQK